MTAGIGSGIGAIFRAPLGGAVLGAEILYRSDLEAEALFPSFIASVTGFSVFAAFEGFAPIFGYLQPGHFDRLQQLPFYAVIGLVAGVTALLYTRVFTEVASVRRLALPPWVKPALAGGWSGSWACSSLGCSAPATDGCNEAMTADGLGSMAIWVVIAFRREDRRHVPHDRVRRVGGIFGPGMVIGGFVGASIWLLVSGISGVPRAPLPTSSSG